MKTNIGHLEMAAGIAGLLKAVLAIRHKQIPANIHFEEINPYITLEGTPFYVADRLTPWKATTGEDGSPLPRRAGVSSFGFSGANAHVVLEEHIPRTRPSRANGQAPQLIIVSAKTDDRLHAYVHSLHAYLEKETVDLVDLAYTLQVGRDEMPARLAVIASSTADLKEKFSEFLAGGEPTHVYHHDTRDKAANVSAAAERDGEIQALIDQRDLAALAARWVSGAKIDGRLLYGPDTPTRLSLPTYPFARERYWIPSADGAGAAERRPPGTPGAPVLHPLIHRNVSTLAEQKFASRFSGEEFYLADHVVETQKILPGVAYIEMARAAGALAGKAPVRIIRNLTWERPLIVGRGGQEVEIALVPVSNEIKFAVTSVGPDRSIVHCTGKLAYTSDTSAPDVVDVTAIRDRCPDAHAAFESAAGSARNTHGW